MRLHSRKNLAQVAVIAVLAVGAVSTVQAAPLWWDINGATPGASPGAGANGNWNDNNWSASADGDVATGAYVSNSDVHFSAGVNATSFATVNIGVTNQDVNKLVVEEGSPIIVGGTGTDPSWYQGSITLTSANPEIEHHGDQFWLRTALITANGFTKTGAGLLLIAGNASVSGDVNVDAGGVTIGDSLGFSWAFPNATANAAFKLNNAGVFAGPTAGRTVNFGSLEGMAGSLFQVAANTNVAMTTAVIGTLDDADTVFAGNVINNAQNGNGFNQAAVTRLAITKTGTGTLTFSGNNSYAGATVINGGTLVAASNTALGFGGRQGLNTPATGTTVSGATAQATLEFGDGVAINEAITLSGGPFAAQLLVSAGSAAALEDGVADIHLTNAGQGYSTNGPTTAITLVGGGGSGAEASGRIQGALPSRPFQKLGLDVAGSGYVSAPTVVFEAELTEDGIHAAATAILSSLTLVGTNNNIGGDGDLTIKAQVHGAGGGFTKVGDGSVTLNGANSYTGSTTIDAGALVVNGSVQSSIAINSLGTLSGVGVINGDVSGDGTVSPGASIGALGVNGDYSVSGTHFFDIAKTSGPNYDNDLIDQIGLLTYAGNLKVELDAGSDPIGTFAAGDQWQLFSFSSHTGAFANDALFGTSGDGAYLPILDSSLMWTFDYGSGVLGIAAIPEPSTIALGCLGAVGLISLAQRQRRQGKG